MQYEDESLFDQTQFNEVIRGLPGDKVLLSDEAFSGKPTFCYMNRFMIANRLHQAMPKARILIMIRGQLELIQSLYSEHIKRGGTGTIDQMVRNPDGRVEYTFEDYLAQANNNFRASVIEQKGYSLYYDTNHPYFHLSGWDYHALIQLYTSHFDDVEVIPYELIRADPEAFITRIEDFLELQMPSSLLEDLQKTRENVRLTNRELTVKRYLNGSSIPGRMKYYLERLLLFSESTAKTAWSVPQQIEDEIRAYFQPRNENLNKLFPEIGLDQFSEDYFLTDEN